MPTPTELPTRVVITECDHDSFAPDHELTDPGHRRADGRPTANEITDEKYTVYFPVEEKQ